MKRVLYLLCGSCHRNLVDVRESRGMLFHDSLPLEIKPRPNVNWHAVDGEQRSKIRGPDGRDREVWVQHQHQPVISSLRTYAVICRCGRHHVFRSDRVVAYWRANVAEARTRVVRAMLGLDL